MNKSNCKIISVFLFIISFMLSGLSQSQPVEEWVQKYDNSGSNDVARDMTTDDEGNVLITGLSEEFQFGHSIISNVTFIIKYSPAGNLIWKTNSYNSMIPFDIQTDIHNNAYVCGYTDYGDNRIYFNVLKISSAGRLLSFYSEEFTSDKGIPQKPLHGIVLNENGEVLIAGRTGFSKNVFVKKYSSDGMLQISNYFASKYEHIDFVSMKTDDNDNILIAGTYIVNDNEKDYLLVKFNKDLKLMWSKRYTGNSSKDLLESKDELKGLALDYEGNAFVTGKSKGKNGMDFCTIKYSMDGEELWVSKLDNESVSKNIPFDDEPVDIKFNGSWDVYISGNSNSGNRLNYVLTEKISTDGRIQWVRVLKNSENNIARFYAADMEMNHYGETYITGYTESSGLYQSSETGKDIFTAKYSPDGELQWNTLYNGSADAGNNDDYAGAVSLNGSGEIYVFGDTQNEKNKRDFCLLKYTDYLSNAVNDNNNENSFILNNNFPNPFNPSTKISFSIPLTSFVRLSVYDITGREVAVLLNNQLSSGNHITEWNAENYASGTYFYKIQAGSFVQTKRMLLIK